MVQVFIAKKAHEEPMVVEKITIIEELSAEKEEFKRTIIKTEEKPFKKALLKLMKKAKYNAKYLEERIPLDKVKRNINYRNTGLY
ncbi:MAG: hypothetical protein ACW98D_06820 [Promethearchaeota archaeon]|jgi:hypothetical protein